MYYRKRIYSGAVEEEEVYQSRRVAGKRIPRSGNIRSTDREQAARNWRDSLKNWIRMVNVNFGRKDLFVVFTYPKRACADVDEASRIWRRRFLPRLRREFKRMKRKLRWVMMTEDKNGHVHHHVVMSGMSLDALKGLWKEGIVRVGQLDPDEAYGDMVKYMSEKKKNTRRWSCSRGLEKPLVIREEISRAEYEKGLKVESKPGWTVIDGYVDATSEGGAYSYTMRKKTGGLTARQIARRQAYYRRKNGAGKRAA
jgi:hypothetical protein